jgi:hypothetical protein
MRHIQQFWIDRIEGVRPKPRFVRGQIAVAILGVRKQTGICGYPRRWRPILSAQPRKRYSLGQAISM